MEHVMLRRIIVGAALSIGMALGVLGDAGSAYAQSGPLCTRFEASSTEGWGACAGAPNIVITTTDVGSIGGAGDYHLHLRDTSGASAACSTNEKYLGDWVKKMGGCGQFCFDFKVFVSGSPPGPITPSFSIWSGGLRAVFVANFTVTSADPWRRQICAPIQLIQNGENLPAGGSGGWQIAPTGGGYNANWNTIIQNVTMVMLPVDFTKSPSEEVGYDNMCMNPAACPEQPKPPEVTGCLKDMKVDVKCNPDGSYTVTLSGAGFSASDITLTSLTPGVTVAPPQQPWAATTTWTISGATPGQAVVLATNETKVGGGGAPGIDQCCSGEIKLVMPECKKPDDQKIDLAVVKTGGTSPVPQVNGYAFHLAVTSVGTPFSGANAITVTDVVPAGMTFNSATGTNWTCATLPAAAGSTITCTYTGAGPTAPNQSLGTIDIVATAMGSAPFPPFTNCAMVGLKPGSGLSDGNPPNDKSCVTVTKPPPADCLPPMVPGAFPGQCICPQGTVLKGRECVKQEACALPMIPGPVAGVCVCPQGLVQQGKRCVPALQCRAPLVPNAAGTVCVCKPGLVPKGRTCVEQPTCKPPAKLNRRGACECPTDMVARGNSCVERERPRPQVSPGDFIRTIPGGGRDNPRGRDTDSPRGGGQGPADFPGKR